MKVSGDRSPHAPIENLDEDLLGRGDFVRRLVNALITDDNRRARGRVLALDGSWGAGKSSLLNLVADELERRCGSRLVLLRFNPWLVASGDDLLRAFFKEFSEALPNEWRGLCGWLAAPGPTARTAFRKAAGDLLVLAADGATGGWAAAAVLAGKSLTYLGETTPTLSEIRGKLHDALAKLDRPIVVLIDEIDRAEPEEIRAMMMLIRAVVDAPNVTYLLAYDGARLREVLGDRDAVRGGRYLEKIVQVELPVPLPETAVLLRILDKHVWPEGVPPGSEARWRRLCQALFPRVIGSFRSLWRVQETFAVLRDMTLGEIDEVDLVGAAALKALYPQVWDRLRADWVELPESGTLDEPFGYMRLVERMLEETVFTWDRWELEESLPEARLLSCLFPAIKFSPDQKFGFGTDDASPSDVRLLRQGRPLQILMRLDRMRGIPTLAEARHWLQEARGEVAARLLRCTDDAELDILEEAFCRAITAEGHVGFPNVWCGVSDALVDGYRTADLGSLPVTQEKLFKRQQLWMQCWYPILRTEQPGGHSSSRDTLMALVNEGEVVFTADLINILASSWELPGFAGPFDSLPGIDKKTVQDALKKSQAENMRLITSGSWLSCQLVGNGYRLLGAVHPNGLPPELKACLNDALHDDRQAAFAACLTRTGIDSGFSRQMVCYLFDEATFVAAMERLSNGGHGELSQWVSAVRSSGWFGNEVAT